MMMSIDVHAGVGLSVVEVGVGSHLFDMFLSFVREPKTFLVEERQEFLLQRRSRVGMPPEHF